MTTRRAVYARLALLLGLLVFALCYWDIVRFRSHNLESLPVAQTQMAHAGETARAEAERTERHGPEVRRVIEEYETLQHGSEFTEGMSEEEEQAVRYFLPGRRTPAPSAADDPGATRFVVTAIQVEWVRVIEYSEEHFKAVARVDRVYDEVARDGTVVSGAQEDYWCGVYVFGRQRGTWELAGYFPTTDRRASGTVRNEWQHVTGDLRNAIGDLPEGDLCPP